MDIFRKVDTMSTTMAEITKRSRRPRRRFDDDFSRPVPRCPDHQWPAPPRLMGDPPAHAALAVRARGPGAPVTNP